MVRVSEELGLRTQITSLRAELEREIDAAAEIAERASTEVASLRTALSEAEDRYQGAVEIIEEQDAKLQRAEERVRIQAGMLAELDAMKCDLAAARKVIEFCSTFSIMDSNSTDVAEDSIHEIRKCARAFLKRTAIP